MKNLENKLSLKQIRKRIGTGALALSIAFGGFFAQGCGDDGGSSTPTPDPDPIENCIDNDGDGYGDYCEAGVDINDNDPTCYPGAGEIVYTKIMSDNKQQLFTYNLETKIEERLTDNNLYDRHARFSPDGEDIIFTRAGDGYDKIYKINKETKTETQIINKSGHCRYASYSPDGLKIVFAFHNSSDWDIYTANSDGSNQNCIVNNSANDTMPFWGNDSNIYFRTNRDGNMETYRINPNTFIEERITQTTDNERTIPVLSPNGDYLAIGIGPIDQEDIYTINLNGNFPLNETSRIQLTTNNKNNFWYSWSKNGNKLTNSSYDYDNNIARINIMNKDGSNKANPFNDQNNRLYPDWSKN